MSSTKSSTVYVVNRLNWVRGSEGELRLLPGEIRIRSFDDREAAEDERRRLDADARSRVNPFRCGYAGLHNRTSLDAPRLHDWILDAGLEPPSPKEDPINWISWWDRSEAAMTDYQRAKMWEAMDRIQFHEVSEQPRREVVYAVVCVGWSYNDEYFTAEPEGGEVTEAYRDRRAAEKHCEDANEMARDQWADNLDITEDDPESSHQFDIDVRTQRALGPFEALSRDETSEPYDQLIPLQSVNFYEVIEVELDS